MRILRSSVAAAVLLAMVALPAVLRSDDDADNASRDALHAAQKLLRSRVPAQRAEGVRALAALPPLDGAKLIAPRLLLDFQSEVKRAAYETLLAWKDHRDVCIFLHRLLDKELRSKKCRAELGGTLLAVLLASDSPETQHDLKKLLDVTVTTGRGSALAVITVADAWGNQGDQQALTALQKMVKLQCFTDVFGCRRAVVQALVMIRTPEAIDELMALLPKVDGEVRGDIVRHLTAVTRQQLGFDAGAWKTWWKQHREGFEFPPPDAKAPAPPLELAGLPSYYGLSIQARRLIFVVDISGSMEGMRIQTLKRELVQAIQGLPGDASFNIVAFSTRVGVWQRNMLEATPANKQRAALYVSSLRPNGETASYDALEAALGFDIEAVYFLSDGDPNFGKITAPAAIVDAIVKENRARRVSVYTIGIAPGPPGGRLDSFMKALAEENLGIYRRVDR
ncbi:MAG: VWA domain-containing protein [Thermoguttaceae bacterium]